jgi:CheY-like chemotaxis protein
MFHFIRKEKMKKILVAEDNDSNFLLMTYVLKKHYEYVRAHNGLEAVTMADDEGIDLILMDLRMPIKDGLQASSEIKAKRPDLPIIALTANAFGSDKEDALAAGCDDFIAKPVSHDICLKMIRKYIGE